MAPSWTKVLVFAAFAASSAEVCEQDCDHEVLLLQVETQFLKHGAHTDGAAQREAEADESVLMQTEAEVTEGASAQAMKDKAAALFTSSLLAPKSKEVKAYFERRRERNANQKTPDKGEAASLLTDSSVLAPEAPEAIQQPVPGPSAPGREPGFHGLASLGSLGSIFAPNEQVSEYLKMKRARANSAAVPEIQDPAAPPAPALAQTKASSRGFKFGGSVLAPNSEEVRAYMKRRREQKMIQEMKQKHKTIMMVVPASGAPQAVAEEKAALSFKDEFAAAAVSVGAAAVVGVAAAR